jgi:hypothetical protein
MVNKKKTQNLRRGSYTVVIGDGLDTTSSCNGNVAIVAAEIYSDYGHSGHNCSHFVSQG